MRRSWPTGGCCAPPSPPKKVESIILDEKSCYSSVIYGIGIQGRLHKKGLRSQRNIENGVEGLELGR
jgi:hypothetical protein